MSNPNGPIVVGVDGSEGGQDAVQWAVAEAIYRHSPLIALAAWSWLDQKGKFDVDYGASDVAAMATKAIDLARQDIAGTDGVDVTIRTVNDHAARALIDASDEASLLVVGSRGLGGFKGLMLGSVSSQCVHHARCPVVVVRVGANGGPQD